jgi:hypothetical protein
VTPLILLAFVVEPGLRARARSTVGGGVWTVGASVFVWAVDALPRTWDGDSCST